MDLRAAHRRAQMYRQRSRALAEEAKHEFRDVSRRLHLLDLAQTFQRTADVMAPEAPPQTDIGTIVPRVRPERRCPVRDGGGN